MSEIILEYKPARLHETLTECYVSYYAYNPSTMKLQRIRVRLNHILNSKDRKRYGNDLVKELNNKLRSGWNPLRKATLNNGIKMKDAIQTYLRNKEKELRPDSMRSYRSIAKYFLEWLKTHELNLAPQNFETGYALRMMNEIGQEKGLRTHNNYLRWMNGLFNWFIENEYCKENPFGKIKLKQTEEKARQVIDTEWRAIIWRWMERNNPNLQFAASLVYYCFIRPTEITFLKPIHFNLEAQTILIPAEASKNRKAQRVTIPDQAIKNMSDWFRQRNIDKNSFLFSDTKSLVHGKTQMKGYYFARVWDLMRKELEFPKEYQLYSLKDTGIIQMLEDGVPPNEVMLQARHHDLSVTTEYLKHTSRGNSQYNVKTKTTSITG